MKKLIIKEDSGIKIGLIGLFLAIIGFILERTVFPSATWIVAIGIILGNIGGIIHFCYHKKQIFPFFKKE